MIDARKIFGVENTTYTYYGTYKNVKPKDTLKTNDKRELIGLKRLKF